VQRNEILGHLKTLIFGRSKDIGPKMVQILISFGKGEFLTYICSPEKETIALVFDEGSHNNH
jgi:hypothetical protein